MSENKKNKLSIIESNNDGFEVLHLENPLSYQEVQTRRKINQYPDAPNLIHKYLKDGIYHQGFVESELPSLHKIVIEVLEQVNTIPDEHIKELTLITAGFLRSMEVMKFKERVRIGNDFKAQDVIALTLYFRFTTDDCPSGITMMEKSKKLIEKNVVWLGEMSDICLTVDYVHGGSPWVIDDINDRRQRYIVSESVKYFERKEVNQKSSLSELH